MKTYYLAKVLKKMRLASFKNCTLHETSRVDAECTLSYVKMGRYSYVASNTRITDAEIGSFTSIGGKCGIGGGIHPLDAVSTSPVFFKGKNFLGRNFSEIPYHSSEKVIIGNDVWIGEGVYIKPGVTIGDGAVIGAHTVVTHDVAPYTVNAGVPSEVIRSRFSEEIITKLLDIRWWEWDDERITRMKEGFTSPEKLFEMIETESKQSQQQ